MIVAWMNYSLLIALIVIGFVCGLKIGRMQAEDEMKRNKDATLPVASLTQLKGNAR